MSFRAEARCSVDFEMLRLASRINSQKMMAIASKRQMSARLAYDDTQRCFPTRAARRLTLLHISAFARYYARYSARHLATSRLFSACYGLQREFFDGVAEQQRSTYKYGNTLFQRHSDDICRRFRFGLLLYFEASLQTLLYY